MAEKIDMKTYKFYCDESMNAGSNALDDNQRFYVVGGFSLDEKFEDIVKKEIECIKEKHKIKTDELKCNHLFRRKKYNTIRKLLNIIWKYGELDSLSILEYRFSIAMRITEELFDPISNKIFKTEFLHDEIGKKLFASLSYLYPDEILENFHIAYINSNIGLMRETISMMIDNKVEFSYEMRNQFMKDYLNKDYNIINNPLGSMKCRRIFEKYYEDYYKGLEYIKDNLEDVVRVYESNNTKLLTNVLNLPCLVTLLKNINSIENKKDKKSNYNIIHDNNNFESMYNEYFSKVNNARDDEVRIGNSIMYYGSLNRVKKISYVDSKDNVFVQLADILVGVVSRYYNNLSSMKSNKSFCKDELEIYIKINDILWRRPERYHISVSNVAKKNNVNKLTKLIKHNKIKIEEIIDIDFYKN